MIRFFFYPVNPKAYSLVGRDKLNDHTCKHKTATVTMLRRPTVQKGGPDPVREVRKAFPEDMMMDGEQV